MQTSPLYRLLTPVERRDERWWEVMRGDERHRPRIEKSHLKRHELLFSRIAKLNYPALAGWTTKIQQEFVVFQVRFLHSWAGLSVNTVCPPVYKINPLHFVAINKTYQKYKHTRTHTHTNGLLEPFLDPFSYISPPPGLILCDWPEFLEWGKFFNISPRSWPLKKIVSAILSPDITTPPRSSRRHTVRQFIDFVVVDTKRFIGSNVNVILTRQTCGQRSSSVPDLSWCGLIWRRITGNPLGGCPYKKKLGPVTS